MGKTNVVLSDGTVVSVDEETAKQLNPQMGRRESDEENLARGFKERNAEQTSGLGEGFAAAVQGGADTLSGGAYGRVLTPEEKMEYQGRAEARPYSRMAGEFGAMLLPVGAPGAAAKIGEAATSFAGRAVGRFAEGAALGAVGKVAETNVTGDPLTIEGVVESAGIGGILNYGVGKVADKLIGASGKASVAISKAEQEAADVTTAENWGELLKKPPPSWNEVRDAVRVNRQAENKLARDIDSETKKYDGFVKSKRMGKAIDNVGEVVRDIRGRYSGLAPEAAVVDAEASLIEKSLTLGKAGEGGPTKPPISPELDVRLKDFEARRSRAYQMWGGGWSNEGGHWKLSPGSPPDYEGAMAELRSMQGELRQQFPKASSKLSDLPNPPRTPVETSDAVALPTSPRQFARMHADSIETLASDLQRWEAGGNTTASEAIGRFADDMGLQRGASTAETFAAVRQTLGDYTSAIERAETVSAAEDAKGPGLISWARKTSKRMAQYSAARGVDVGGWKGAAARTIVGSAVGYAMDGTEGALLGATMLNGKLGIRSKMQNLVAKYGARVGQTVETYGAKAGLTVAQGHARSSDLGNVTDMLGRSFPSGAPDPETDPRKQAINRIREVTAMQATAPDATYLAMEHAMGHPSDVAWKIHSLVNGAVQYLGMTAPKDPGLNVHMFESNWTPSWTQTMEFAHRLEAVVDPLKAIARSLAGDGHPAATETLWTVWQAMMQQGTHEIGMATQQLNGITYERASAYSQLFRVPLTALQTPQIATLLQGLYLPKPEQGGQTSAPSKHPVGRPAAVQSSLAGSTPAAHQNQ